MIVLPTLRWPDEEMEVEVQKQLQNVATLNEGLTSTGKRREFLDVWRDCKPFKQMEINRPSGAQQKTLCSAEELNSFVAIGVRTPGFD